MEFQVKNGQGLSKQGIIEYLGVLEQELLDRTTDDLSRVLEQN